MNRNILVLLCLWSVASAGILPPNWLSERQVSNLRIKRSSQIEVQDEPVIIIGAYRKKPQSNYDEWKSNLKQVRSVIILEETVEPNYAELRTDIRAVENSDTVETQKAEARASQHTLESIENESPKTEPGESDTHKKVRSVTSTVLGEYEANILDKNLEAFETPASTSIPPRQFFYSAHSNSHNLGWSSHPSYPGYFHPTVSAHNHYGPSGYPGHLDHHQSTISPTHKYPAYQTATHIPSQLAVSIVENSPTSQFAVSGASSTGLNGSAVSLAQNNGRGQTAVSLTSSNGPSVASRSDRTESSSVAQTFNGSQNTVATSLSTPNFQSATSYAGSH